MPISLNGGFGEFDIGTGSTLDNRGTIMEVTRDSSPNNNNFSNNPGTIVDRDAKIINNGKMILDITDEGVGTVSVFYVF